jgi:hypothetical protein
VLDAAIVGTAAALLWWVYLLSPLTAAPDMQLAARLVSVIIRSWICWSWMSRCG